MIMKCAFGDKMCISQGKRHIWTLCLRTSQDGGSTHLYVHPLDSKSIVSSRSVNIDADARPRDPPAPKVALLHVGD